MRSISYSKAFFPSGPMEGGHKRAAPDEDAGGDVKRTTTGERSGVDFSALTAGDFSTWTFDAASGWTTAPCATWMYNPTTFMFYHAVSGGYYQYDTAQKTYVAVGPLYAAARLA